MGIKSRTKNLRARQNANKIKYIYFTNFIERTFLTRTVAQFSTRSILFHRAGSVINRGKHDAGTQKHRDNEVPQQEHVGRVHPYREHSRWKVVN